MNEEQIYWVALVAMTVSGLFFLVTLLLFFIARRNVLNYIVNNFTEQLEAWGVGVGGSSTRYARWGLINQYAEETNSQLLMRKLYYFRTTQLIASDTFVVAIAMSVLYLWAFSPF